MNTFPRILIVLCSLALITHGTICQASDPIKEKIDEAIEEVHEYLKSEKAKKSLPEIQIELGKITNQTGFSLAGSSGIEKAIHEALKARGILWTDENGVKRSVYTLESIITLPQETASNDRFVRITFVLLDPFKDPAKGLGEYEFEIPQHNQSEATKDTVVTEDGTKKQKVSVKLADDLKDDKVTKALKDNGDTNAVALRKDISAEKSLSSDNVIEEAQAKTAIATTFGLTGSFEAHSTEDLLLNPQGEIFRSNEARIKSYDLFGVKVSSVNQFKNLRLVGGSPFVDLENGEEFVVHITNYSSTAVAVQISVDGLNVFHRSEQKGISDYYILAPRSSYRFDGWHIDATRKAAFVATPFEKSVRAKKGLGEELAGAITVTFFDTAAPSELKTITEAVNVQDENGKAKTVTIQRRVRKVKKLGGVYVGEGDVVETKDAGVSDHVPMEALGSISILYRHPDVNKNLSDLPQK